MSASAQTNGKKSSNSSAVNTPASTPVTNGNSQTISQSTPPPPNNNAPKYGTLVPNRIFVGGISANTTEGELLQLFSTYGTVKAAKIIQDRAGVSKGYGFITFESEDDAKRPLKDADNIVLKERKLNIAPAIKKQPFNRAFDASSPSTVAPGNTGPYFFPPSAGVPYFQGGVTYYQQPPTAPGDPNSQTTVYQAPPVYPAQTGPPQGPSYPSMMFPHHIYMPQQYAMPPMPYEYNYYPNNGGGQYMVGGGSNGPGNGSNGNSQNGPPMPSSGSPPRQPCYNTAQLPAFGPDPIYYNMPAVYGGPVEGTPIFSEGLDMSNSGVYPEVSQILDHCLGGFADGIDVQGPYPVAAEDTLDTDHETTDTDNSRQSKTPVVSLLSMEQHQEKDFVSMQGGRRVKPLPPPPQPPPQPVVIPHYPQQNHPPPPPIYYNYHPPPLRSHPNTAKTTNGYRKPRCYNRTNDNSSRSSLRTDSNSSANATIDENKNEEKITPSFHVYNNTRTYQNSLNRRPKRDTDNNNKKNNFVVQSQQIRNNGAPSYVTSSSTRRNKRTTRRNVQAGSSLSEIGAGDAPLPNNDVTDTCKKMETLKM